MAVRVRLLVCLGLCALSLTSVAETQVLVYKVRQKQVANFHRLSSVSWESRAIPATAYLVVEVGGTGTVSAAGLLSYWSEGAQRRYQVTDPTLENLSLARFGGSHRALLWNTATRKGLCYGVAPGSSVILATAYTGYSTEIVEEPYAGSTRVKSVTAVALALRMDKTLSGQANVVHDVAAFLQILVTGLEAKGYTDADAPTP